MQPEKYDDIVESSFCPIPNVLFKQDKYEQMAHKLTAEEARVHNSQKLIATQECTTAGTY